MLPSLPRLVQMRQAAVAALNSKLKLVTDDLPKNTWVVLGLAKRVYFF